VRELRRWPAIKARWSLGVAIREGKGQGGAMRHCALMARLVGGGEEWGRRVEVGDDPDVWVPSVSG
jgi:hypothetical protein